MIISISTEKGQVCTHFGHASEFTFVKIEANKVIEKKSIIKSGTSSWDYS